MMGRTDLMVLVVTSISVITRAQEGSGGDDALSLELADNDYSEYNPNNAYDDYHDYGEGNIDDLLRLDNPTRGDMGDEEIYVGEDWTGLDYHNDFLDPVFCRENCQGARDPDNIACAKSCPPTPWVGQEDVSLELSCSTEAAVLKYNLSKLLEKNFTDLKIELSQEKDDKEEESLEAGEESTEYPIINIDQDDRENEVSDWFNDVW